MGTLRNGARTGLTLLAKVCKLSRTPGWRAGVTTILGPDDAAAFILVWEPLCLFVDTLVAQDNWFNQVDYQEETVGSEDIGGGS